MKPAYPLGLGTSSIISPLQQRLAAVCQHAPSSPLRAHNEAHRYIPRAADITGRWGVWDRKMHRFLNDRELMAVPFALLQGEMYHDA